MEIVVKQINSKSSEKLKYGLDPKDKVSKLRRLVASDLGTEESSIKLIFKGRFLKDETELEIHGLQDGSVVHAMNSSSRKPLSLEQTGGTVTSGEYSETGNGVTNQTSSVQNSNLGDVLRNFGSGDDRIQNVVESNPELRAMIEDPEQMRSMMEIASNPQLRLEYMRNMDRALSNIESLPGGFNALASMMNDATDSQSRTGTTTIPTPDNVNPFVRLFPTSETAGINENPLPNPWQRNRDSRPPSHNVGPMSIPGNHDTSGLLQSQEEMAAMMNSMLSEENIREFNRIMRDPDTRSRMLRDVLGEEGSQQIPGQMLESLISDFDSIGGNLRDGLGLLGPIGSMSASREIDESEMNTKIQILKDMGFPNEDANRRALQTSGGDVNGAVEILLNAPSAF
jgi:hypothetical protein